MHFGTKKKKKKKFIFGIFIPVLPEYCTDTSIVNNSCVPGRVTRWPTWIPKSGIDNKIGTHIKLVVNYYIVRAHIDVTVYLIT